MGLWSEFAYTKLEGGFLFSPSLSKYRGRSEPTFRQEEEVFFQGMVSLEEAGRTGAGEALKTVSFAKWLPGRNLQKPLVSTIVKLALRSPRHLLKIVCAFYVALYIF